MKCLLTYPQTRLFGTMCGNSKSPNAQAIPKKNAEILEQAKLDVFGIALNH